MKQLILLSFLLLSGGCFTPLALDGFDKENKTKSYMIFGEESIEAGISEEGEIVLEKISVNRTGGSYSLYRIVIKGSNGSYVMEPISEVPNTIRAIPIYIESEVDEGKEEYVKILDSITGKTQIELKIRGQGSEVFDLDTYYSNDTYYLKRTGFALAVPVLVALDTSLFLIAATLSAKGSTRDFYKFFDE